MFTIKDITRQLAYSEIKTSTLEWEYCIKHKHGISTHNPYHGLTFVEAEELPIDAKLIETLRGIGYQGGHVSQSHWDTDQEIKLMIEGLSEGHYVKDITIWGNVGRYIPAVEVYRS